MIHTKRHTCKACGRAFDRIPARICVSCRMPVNRHAKYRWVMIKVRGKAVSTIKHLNCKTPESYPGDRKGAYA